MTLRGHERVECRLATALLLAKQGAEVVMVGRDRTQANFVHAEIAKCAAGSEPLAGRWAMSEALYESLQGVIANRPEREYQWKTAMIFTTKTTRLTAS